MTLDTASILPAHSFHHPIYLLTLGHHWNVLSIDPDTFVMPRASDVLTPPFTQVKFYIPSFTYSLVYVPSPLPCNSLLSSYAPDETPTFSLT